MKSQIKKILPFQIWKSNYSDIYYKVFGGSINDVEMYNIDNAWDSKVVRKKELKKHFTLQ
jgi:hypothetical protein|tara:strand:+ start:623 stop:802 length:180 start_codon:yes stop_codon:yes gene_type:complete